MFESKHASLLINAIASVAPIISARIIYQVWTATKRTQRRPPEQACLQNAKKNTLTIENEKIAVYFWGDGPRVLLLHGWNGRATQYFAFIESLQAHGYGVLAFDAPGHGDSSGKQTNLFQFVKVLEMLDAEYGEFEAVIAHSFGTTVAVNALVKGLRSKALVGISSPADYNLLLKSFTTHFGLNDKAEQAFFKLLKQKNNINCFDEISIYYLAKEMNLPCLVVHGENDRQVPVTEAYKIIKTWPNAELYTAKGNGHSRILYNQDVIGKCISFLENLKLC